jgi:hypothetical protein
MYDPLQPNRRDPFGKCFSFRKAGARKAKITPLSFPPAAVYRASMLPRRTDPRKVVREG